LICYRGAAVGTSYQTLLVVAELAQTRQALEPTGVEAFLAPAGPGRTAVMPREGEADYADTSGLARFVSRRFGYPALTNVVADSDVVLMRVYRNGRRVHEYVSDTAMLVDWFIDEDGRTRFRIDDMEFPVDATAPSGPSGADPAWLVDFGLGEVDPDHLGAVMRGDAIGERPMPAHDWHRQILDVLNLDPRGLTIAYREAQRGSAVAGAVRIGAAEGQ
jgi:hypothetical protein